MPYEFDEIKFLSYESVDWWDCLKKFPIKILDQDFGMEVPLSDLSNFTVPVKDAKEAVDASSSSEDKQDAAIPAKVFDLDTFKRKEDLLEKTGYSRVMLEKDHFVAEICSHQFTKSDFSVRLVKGFVVITAIREEHEEGDGIVWRKFERRYMLPHDCHVSDTIDQTEIEPFDGGIRVRVAKTSRRDFKKTPGKSPLLKSPVQSPTRKQASPKKESPMKESPMKE